MNESSEVRVNLVAVKALEACEQQNFRLAVLRLMSSVPLRRFVVSKMKGGYDIDMKQFLDGDEFALLLPYKDQLMPSLLSFVEMVFASMAALELKEDDNRKR